MATISRPPAAAFPPHLLLPLTFLLLSRRLGTADASRAYPHGCLYRHPSYYTYDERDDVSWVDDDDERSERSDRFSSADFRRLPPRSSGLRRPYARYRLTRRLGAGKFSDVFEAVDVEWAEWEERSEAGRRRKRARETGSEEEGSDGSGSEGGGVKAVKAGRCGETTEAEDTEADGEEDGNEDGEGMLVPDVESLVVLKCLKPVSERKIRRELLVLTHCATLPNLARVIGIVLPESMDGEEEEEGEEVEEVGKSTSTPAHPKRQRRHHHLQRENIGCITDAASVKVVRQRKGAATQAKNNNAQNNNAHEDGKHQGTQLPALVLEHAGQNSQWLCHPQRPTRDDGGDDHLSEHEAKYYLCHLLLALDGLHAAGIMHRDVKPRNTMINRPPRGPRARGDARPEAPRPLVLVDLGLADFYLPGRGYNVRVASRHYKAPELLMGHGHYDYAVDVWSAGCVLAGLLFRREPFFRGKDNEDQLGKIVSVLGTRDFLPYCRKCGVRLSSKARAAIGKYCSRAAPSSSSSSSEEASSTTPSLLDNDMGRRTPWMSFLPPPAGAAAADCPVPSPEALDLLDRLLVYDHEQRWTAREALGHPFFDGVRERVLREVRERVAWEEGREEEKEVRRRSDGADRQSH